MVRSDVSDTIQFADRTHQLHCAILHSTSDVHSGHYITLVNTPQKEWSWLNGDTATPVSASAMVSYSRAHRTFTVFEIHMRFA